MSLPRARAVYDGNISATIYDFAAVGDELPAHSHTDADKHYTIVCRGAIKVFGPWGEETIVSGDIRRFKANLMHGFTALEANSRVVNIKY